MYWIDTAQEYTGTPAIRNFYCDSPSDVSSLPTSQQDGVPQGDDTISCQKVSPGSSCLCIGSSEVYMLDSSDNWISV